MIYTCVETEVKGTGGQQYAVLWFKKNPDDKDEKPIRLVQFDRYVIDNIQRGIVDKYLDIEQIEYPLQQPMKYPNGVVVDKLHLNCVKATMWEEVFNGDSFELGHYRRVGSTWARGFSPEELAAAQMHILVPIQEH